jgi:hypothetical protein
MLLLLLLLLHRGSSLRKPIGPHLLTRSTLACLF